METAQEFIERYLHEKSQISQVTRQSTTALNQKFFRQDYLKHLQEWQDTLGHISESIVRADVSETSVKIFTVTVIGKTQYHYRYHLVFAAEAWKITNQERECLLCNGTGQKNGVVCPICKGEVWSQLYKTP